MKHALLSLLAVATLCGTVAGNGIDLDRSRITIHVYKSGMFSAFADNHVIEAKLREGSLKPDEPAAVSIVVRAADLRVLDPGVDPAKRAEIQERMLGPEVLDANRFGEIRFTSTAVRQTAGDRWTVAGNLTIHGRTQPLSFDVARTDALYRGSVRLSQRDFGITPISIVGGTVKVKDVVVVEFEIAAMP